MGDLIRSIIRWAIVILIIILIIFLFTKIAGKGKASTTPVDSGVKTLKQLTNDDTNTNTNTNSSGDEPQLEAIENPEENLEPTVESPNTGVEDYLGILIGVIVLSSGTYFIYKQAKESN